MNTAELILRLGPELGVYGVAVHAFVEAQPDCRYDQIMAGLRMSKAQVLRTVTKLEEVGAVERVKDSTDFGTSKPTIVRCLSQIYQQTPVSTSETPVNTGASDKAPVKTGVSHSDSASDSDTHVSLVSPTETPINTEETLSDAKDGCLSQRHPPNQGKVRGTKVAPLKAETISSNNSPPSPSAQGGAAKARPKVVPHPSARGETDHQRLMRELFARTGPIPDGKAQGDAVKWLLDKGYKPEECVACLDEFLSELRDASHFRETRVSWLTVRKEIGTWKLRNSEAGRARAAPNGRKSNVEKSMDALNSFIAKEQGSVR